MKHLFTLALLWITLSDLSGQMDLQQVVTPAGGFGIAPSGTFSLSWTIGETLVSGWVSADRQISLSSGMLQSIIVTAIDEIPGLEAEVRVFPVPVSEVLQIEFNEPLSQTFYLYLYNNYGGLIFSERLEKSTHLKQLNLETIASGTYYLRITDGIRYHTYKVVKL